MSSRTAVLEPTATRASVLNQVAGATALSLALVAQQLVHRNPEDLVGWAMFVAALVLVMVTANAVSTPRGVVGSEPAVRRVGMVRLAWAGATLVALAATTVRSTGPDWPVLTLALWGVTLGCGYLATRHWVVTPPSRAPVAWSRAEITTLIAVIALAGLARGLWVDALPRYIFADESRVAIFLKQIYQPGIPNFFTMGWNTWPMIGLSLQGVFGPLLGINTTALRLSSVMMGTLAVLMTYLLARELFTPRVAVLAAVLLAICRTAIDFSRLGTTHAQVLCLEPFALLCWWHAINSGRAASYWWAGVGLGLCLYSYNAGQMVPVLWVSFVVLSALAAPRAVRAYGIGALITLAAFAVTFFPYLFYATDHFTFGNNFGQWTVMARNRQTMSEALDALRSSGLSAAGAVFKRQIWLTWLGFGVLPGGSYGLGYRGGGMLDDVTAPLFVLGLGLTLRRWREPRYAFLPYWWLLTAVVGGVLTIDAPAIVRLVGILPALTILAALALEWLLDIFASWKPTAVVSWLVVAGLLLGAGLQNWWTYFVVFPRGAIDPISQLARTLKELPAHTTIFLVGSEEYFTFDREIFYTDFPDKRLRDIADPAHLLPLHQPITQPLILILGPTQLTLAGYAQTLYPHTDITEVANEVSKQPLLRILRLTAEDVEAQTGLQLTAVDTTGAVVSSRVADPFVVGRDLPAGIHRLHWDGRVYWPTDRPATLTISAEQPVTVRVATAPPLQSLGGRSAETSLTLPWGWQHITIDEEGAQPLSLSIHYGSEDRALSRWDLTPNSAVEGLQGTYERDGQTVVRSLDPLLDVFAQETFYRRPEDQDQLMIHMPFVAAWHGALRIVTPGTYAFDAVGTGAYAVHLDDQVLFDVADARSEDPPPVRASRALTAGLHPIVVRWNCTKREYATRRLFQLYWTPPGSARALIPPLQFSPQ